MHLSEVPKQCGGGDCLLGSFGWYRLGWRADLLLVIDGEKQKLAEGVAAVKALSGEVAVPIGASRKPELQRLVPEAHGTVFDELMITQEPNFRRRPHQV